MSTEIKVPVLPESVTDATIATWHKKVGEKVKQDEHLLDIETDKVILEVVAPADGFLETILKKEGETVKAEEVVGFFKAEALPAKKKETVVSPLIAEKMTKTATMDVAPTGSTVPLLKRVEQQENLSPAARRLAREQQSKITENKATNTESGNSAAILKPSVSTALNEVVADGNRIEKRVPMSRLRARIAERLLQAQENAAILTTFNEINMQPVIGLRQKYKETFEKDYGVRLGFMSFFTIAVVEALKRFPIINASVDNSDIIYHGYYDIGIAIASPRGLVVPIIRNAENLDMPQIEKEISGFSAKAKAGQLSIEEITGGTFTISNGGVFGSLMSTPILNPPQSAILGMHKIEERPIVENGAIVIRPMMYVALSYDHRIIDGAESVQFLVTVKELLEDPARLLLNV